MGMVGMLVEEKCGQECPHYWLMRVRIVDRIH